MPRNEIAAIIGLIVVFWFAFLGPGRGRGLPRDPRALGTLLFVFALAFALTWIALRLIGY